MAVTLSLGLAKVMRDPNKLSTKLGDKPMEEKFFSTGGTKTVLNAVTAATFVHIAAALNLWYWDGFSLLSKWTVLEATTACLCPLGVGLRAWAMHTLGSLYSFQVGIRKEHK